MSRYFLLLAIILVGFSLNAATQKSFEPVLKNRCEIKLVADYSFFKRIGNGNYANCARYLVNLIERVNGIFTSVDWGLSPTGKRLTNMGFVIKEMKILEKPSNAPHHYNSEHSINSNGAFSAIDIFKSFSVEEGTPSTCLTVLISAKVFDMSTLGMANIGRPGSHGLCARKKIDGTYWNTATITVHRRTELMVTRIVDLVVAHELGHAWGAVHDDLSDPECQASDSVNGRYIMHESSNSGYDNNNYKFSPCSIRSIHRVLYDISESCFVSEQAALCGNGILETGEECDPGGQLALGHPNTEDPCCTSTCRLRSTAKCSPRHSECCSETCSYLPRTKICQPKNTDTCNSASYCTGMSDKCPDPKPIEDGTVCTEEGRCRGGECISFCQLLSPMWAPCVCENVTESCYRCCRSPDTGSCMPVKPHRNMPEGSICIQGQCRNNVCIKEATDAAAHFWKITKDIITNPSPKYFADYIVIIVIMASLIVWCPCGFYILYRDQQKQRIPDESGDTPKIGLTRVPGTKRLRRTNVASS